MKSVVPNIYVQLMSLLVLMGNVSQGDFSAIRMTTVEITVMKLAVPQKNVPHMNFSVFNCTDVSPSTGDVTLTEIAATPAMKPIAIKQFQAILVVRLNSNVQTMTAYTFLGAVMATQTAWMEVMNKIAQNIARVKNGDASQVGNLLNPNIQTELQKHVIFCQQIEVKQVVLFYRVFHLNLCNLNFLKKTVGNKVHVQVQKKKNMCTATREI